jgi:hypothetical protein
MLFEQSNISQGNIQTALTWAESDDAEVAALARIVADVGRAHSHRKKRLPSIARKHPGLWKRMVEAGLVDDWVERSQYPEEPEDITGPESLEEPRVVVGHAQPVDCRAQRSREPELMTREGGDVSEKPHVVFDDEDIPF